jgi:hypothetical protein
MKAEPITINHSRQIMLRLMWDDSQHWMAAANGKLAAYNNPMARMLAKESARARLENYFKAIDEIVLKNNSEAA